MKVELDHLAQSSKGRGTISSESGIDGSKAEKGNDGGGW